MAESAALLIDEVLPAVTMRQWVLSVPFALRFLFASNPDAMSDALGIVYRAAGFLIHKAGLTQGNAQCGAVTVIQRFGSALNLSARSSNDCVATLPGRQWRSSDCRSPHRGTFATR